MKENDDLEARILETQLKRSCSNEKLGLNVRELDPEECEKILNDPGAVKVFVEFPEKQSVKSMVLLEKKKITITPVSFEKVSDVSFVVLSALFEDVEDIIEQVNTIVENL